MNEILFPEQSKGRSKKIEVSEPDIDFCSLNFEQKLILELESLDLIHNDLHCC